MVSRTLLQLFTVSIILTEQIEARYLNKTHNVEIQECLENNTSANKRSSKVDEGEENDTLLIKKTYPEQRSDSNLESKYDILARCKYNLKSKHIENEETNSNKPYEEFDNHIKLKTTTRQAKNELTSFDNRKHFPDEDKYRGHAYQVDDSNNRIQKTVVEKTKHDSKTKLKSNDEASFPNDEQEDYQTFQKQRHMLTDKHHNIKKRTTQTMTEKPLLPKRMPSWAHRTTQLDTELELVTELDNERCKTKHCEYTNHRSVEKISQENDRHSMKRQDEITTASKDSNESKHHYRKRNKTFKKELRSENESVKNNDDSHRFSKENEIYKLENRVDILSVEVTKNVEPKFKPKFNNNFQKTKLHKKVGKRGSDKSKHKTHIIHDKVVSKEGLRQSHDNNKEKHNNVRKRKNNVNSEDTLNSDEADAEMSRDSKHDEKETLDSSEEPFTRNDLFFKPNLPFYVTSKTLTKKEIAKKYKSPNKRNSQKDENDVEVTSDDLNKPLLNKADLRNKNLDVNNVMDQIGSSKVFDFLTDRVADHMLKKLQSNQEFKSHLTTIDEPEKVEKIDILFENDGDMIMRKAEDEKNNTY